MSVVPAAANGTMIRTGRLGQADCARAGNAADAAKAANTSRREIFELLMDVSCCRCRTLPKRNGTVHRERSHSCEGEALQALRGGTSVGVPAGGLDDGRPLRDFGHHEL